MRILFAGDENPYSDYALKKVIDLAQHTWADVTVLAVSSAAPAQRGEPPLPAGHPLVKALHRFREDFLKTLGEPGSPYLNQKVVLFQNFADKFCATVPSSGIRDASEETKIGIIIIHVL